MLKAEFTCGYGGGTDYDIRENGRLVAKVYVRDGAWIDFGWNGDYFETGIRPTIGTVRYESCSHYDQFPTPEIVALFPGYVGCRFVFHPRTPDLEITDPLFELPEMEVILDGPAPELFEPMRGYLSFVGNPRFAEKCEVSQ